MKSSKLIVVSYWLNHVHEQSKAKVITRAKIKIVRAMEENKVITTKANLRRIHTHDAYMVQKKTHIRNSP